MFAAKDVSVRELGRTTLRLRSDLVFTPRNFGGKPCYTIEDPVSSKFYRIGIAEYTFLSLLDGRTSISHAVALAAQVDPECALNEHEAAVICKWLVETELAATPESVRPRRLAEVAEKSSRARRWKNWNPAVIRLPIFHPDRFFHWVTPWVSWLYAPALMVLWLVLVTAAAYQVSARWDRFADSARTVLAPQNWFWLGLCWVVLKFIHEVSHGVVCKRFGGVVHEAGLMFIMLAPVAYVDVTSSWRFSSKWQRIYTAAAGIYAEFLVASVAAFVWAGTGPGLVNTVCSNAVIMASLTTVLFNANPLMKYDGYYALSDLFEIPNLYASGLQYLQYWGRRYLLGVSATRPAFVSSKRWVVPAYGIGALIWRIVFSFGLVLVAATYFRGAGIVLSCIAGVTWLGWPAVRFCRYLVNGSETERPNCGRFLTTIALGTAAAAALLALPWPGAVKAPLVVEFAPLVAVRTGCPGFIRQVVVQPGDSVAAGQVLAILENEELTAELADLALAQQQSQLRVRALENKSKLADYQAELENARALDKKYAEKAQQVEQLMLRAPCAGTVIGRDLDAWLGRYAKLGTEILTIGSAMLELRLSIAQDDVDRFTASLGKPVHAHVAGLKSFSAPLTRVNPRATNELPYAALAAPNGGPLTVRAKDQSSATSNPAKSAPDQFELVTPRFTGVVLPDPNRSPALHAGQQGTASLRTFDESIGKHLYRSATRWTEQKLTRSKTAVSLRDSG